MRITEDFVFFYRDWPSNFQKTKFILPDIDWITQLEFCTSEHAFMYAKAIYFRDFEIANLILNTDNPAEARRLGRLVHNYDDKKWSEIRYKIFYAINLAKYTQDKKLQKMLLDPKFDDKIFVEASPIDRIWGIGYSENDDPEYKEHNWGRNFLGKILTNIRTRIIKNKIDDPNWNIYTYYGENNEEVV